MNRTDPRADVRRAIGFDDYTAQHSRLSWGKVAILAAMTGIAVAACAELANAQEAGTPPVCGTAEQVTAELRNYGEHPSAMGATQSGHLIALYVDPDDGSWTIVERVPTDPPQTCLLRAGEGWQGEASGTGRAT